MKHLFIVATLIPACGPINYRPGDFKGYCFETTEKEYCYEIPAECHSYESAHRENRPWIAVETSCKLTRFGE